MNDKRPVDKNYKCCLILAILAVILNFIAFATPFWIVSYAEYNSQFDKLGLWEACFNGYEHPEDYVSKKYYGCWYVFWPEYAYIRDWLNPPWFYAVQAFSSISLIFNGVGFILIMLKFIDVVKLADKTTNILAIVVMVLASCCHIIVVVAMGVMSKDREWLPRPDHNHVSWSFAFAVLAGFFTIFCVFQLLMHYLVYNYAPELVDKKNSTYPHQTPLMDKTGSIMMYPQGGTSTIYSQAPKPVSQVGTTSGATASARVREALTQRVNQNAGSMSSLNNPYNRAKAGSTHSLASIKAANEPRNNNNYPGNTPRDYRGSMSSIHSTTRRVRSPANDEDDTIV